MTLAAQTHVWKVLTDRVIYYCSPTNIKAEKKKFLGQGKTPRFEYPVLRFYAPKLKREIENLTNYEGPFSEIITEFGHRSELSYELVRNVGNPSFPELSKVIYGVPGREAVRLAKEILEDKEHMQEPKIYTSLDVKKALGDAAWKYGWKIVLKKGMSSKMKTRPSLKTLEILKDARFTKRELKRLRYHEIETHVKRWYNNTYLPAQIRNCFDYIETEEGLAVKMEELYDCSTPETQRTYAGRVLAVHLSLKSGFCEVFDALKEYGFDEKTAFHITARAKRGLKDTSAPGGLTKDHIYISGKIKVERYVERGGELGDLFMGKIGVEDVKTLQNYVRD